MKRFCHIIVSLVLLISLYSCSGNDSVTSQRTGLEAETTETITIVDTTESGDELSPLGSVEVGIKDNKASYEFSGEDISINYEYTAVGSKSFGIIVLCDGIAVPFSTDKQNDSQKLHILPNNEDGKRNDVTISFTPIGKSGDKVSVEIVDIVEPDYNIADIDLDGNIMAFIQGKKYLVNYISGITVNMLSDGIAQDNKFYTKAETKPIPQNVIDTSKTIHDDGTVDDQLLNFASEWSVNEKKSLCYKVSQGEKMSIKIRYNGTEGQDIYTSFYIDNELFPVFGGCEYSVCRTDKLHYSEITGTLDTSKLSKGRHICYSVCGNIEYSSTIPTAAFIIEVN